MDTCDWSFLHDMCKPCCFSERYYYVYCDGDFGRWLQQYIQCDGICKSGARAHCIWPYEHLRRRQHFAYSCRREQLFLESGDRSVIHDGSDCYCLPRHNDNIYHYRYQRRRLCGYDYGNDHC